MIDDYTMGYDDGSYDNEDIINEKDKEIAALVATNMTLWEQNERLRAENEKLRAERDTIGEANYVNGWNDAINSSEAMQDLRAENEKLAALSAKASQEASQLRAALKPFAVLDRFASQIQPDKEMFVTYLKAGQVRAAAAALKETGEQK